MIGVFGLKICFATKSSLSAFWESRLSEVDTAKVLIFNAHGLGTVSYESELSGETENFSDLAKLSKEIGSVVIAGCNTDTYGAFRRSVVIADKGKLLGVSDEVFVTEGSEYVGGVNFVVYKTSVGKIGVIVGEDLYSFDAVKSMALGDADFIVCVFDEVSNFAPELVVRAEAFLCGVPIILCANGFGMIAGCKGETEYSTGMDVSVADLDLTRVYGEVFYKKRGYINKPD